MMNVLLLEDEVKAARELAKMIGELDESATVIASLQSVEEAVKWLQNHEHPQLIFSDIQLADGLCFDIFNQLPVQSSIIFCTAFDEYMMKAFDTNAVSYILKPVTKEKVEKALDKWYHFRQSLIHQANIKEVEQLVTNVKSNYKKVLLLHEKEKIIPVKTEDIGFFYFDQSMIEIATLQNHLYFLPGSLDELERLLDRDMFYRANRQFIINRNAVTSIEKFFARKLMAKLCVEPPEKIIISKLKATDFLSWLSQ